MCSDGQSRLIYFLNVWCWYGLQRPLRNLLTTKEQRKQAVSRCLMHVCIVNRSRKA